MKNFILIIVVVALFVFGIPAFAFGAGVNSGVEMLSAEEQEAADRKVEFGSFDGSSQKARKLRSSPESRKIAVRIGGCAPQSTEL